MWSDASLWLWISFPEWLMVMNNLFIYLFICVSTLEKCLFMSFATWWDFVCFLFVFPYFWFICNDKGCLSNNEWKNQDKGWMWLHRGLFGALWRQSHYHGVGSLAGEFLAGFTHLARCDSPGVAEIPLALAKGHIIRRKRIRGGSWL